VTSGDCRNWLAVAGVARGIHGEGVCAALRHRGSLRMASATPWATAPGIPVSGSDVSGWTTSHSLVRSLPGRARYRDSLMIPARSANLLGGTTICTMRAACAVVRPSNAGVGMRWVEGIDSDSRDLGARTTGDSIGCAIAAEDLRACRGWESRNRGETAEADRSSRQEVREAHGARRSEE
jgi:hypothetical protein